MAHRLSRFCYPRVWLIGLDDPIGAKKAANPTSLIVDHTSCQRPCCPDVPESILKVLCFNKFYRADQP